MWVGLLLTAAVSAVIVGVFFSNTGKKNEAPFRRGRPQLVAPLPKTVEFTARDRRDALAVAARFVATAVTRNHTERSYDITDRAFHQGLSRREWATGNIPVVPFPAGAIKFVKWKLDYSYKDRVGLKVSIQPKRTAKVGATVFNIELHRLGAPGHRRWLVDYWTPAGLSAPAPTSAAARHPTPSIPRVSAGLSGKWVIAPVVFVFGLILLIPLVLFLRGWYRGVRANRTYGTLPKP